MKRIFTSVAVLFFLTFQVCALEKEDWTTDFDKALKTAGKSGHPILLDFSATWCGPCQMMARTTLRDTNVLQKLDSFVKVKVDIDANAPLAERFGVHAVPTFVVINNDADELARTSGAMDSPTFTEWLNTTLSTAAFSAARKEMFQKEKQTVAAQLKDANPNAREKAVELLLDYSFRKETYYRDFAQSRLTNAAETNPSAFLPFLNDDKLAVRILAANLLRNKLGPEFDFDPWATAPERNTVVDKWKPRLLPQSN